MRSTTCRRAGYTGIAVLLAFLLAAGGALAEAHHPTGEFAPFWNCPLDTPRLADCLVAEITSGELILGNRTVPITKTLTLTGGFIEEPAGLQYVGAENGDTFTKVPLAIPGGLLDTLPPASESKTQKEKFEEEVDKGPTGITATTELAVPARDIAINIENLLDQSGTSLSLPVRVKLANPALGDLGYLDSAPIEFAMTDGRTSPPKPNEPIEGAILGDHFNSAFTLFTENTRLVDNAFAVSTAASDTQALDQFLDTKLGLPSPAGHNTAILQTRITAASPAAVRESE
jgi:hypothetical protein